MAESHFFSFNVSTTGDCRLLDHIKDFVESMCDPHIENKDGSLSITVPTECHAYSIMGCSEILTAIVLGTITTDLDTWRLMKHCLSSLTASDANSLSRLRYRLSLLEQEKVDLERKVSEMERRMRNCVAALQGSSIRP